MNQIAELRVRDLIEDAESDRRGEEQQALAEQDRAERRQRTHRWASILRLLAVAFLFVIGAVSVSVYLILSSANGNGDILFAVAIGVVGALWLSLVTALRKDFVWLAEAFRGFQN